MGDYIAYKRGMKAGDVHPVIAGMNTLGYEAGTLGNHEFNYGVEFLDLVNAGADFPIVCANFATRARRRARARTTLHLKPYVILDAHASPTAPARRTRSRSGSSASCRRRSCSGTAATSRAGSQTRDILEAARAWVPEMREAGADVVVALSHSGIDPAADAAMMENASLQLAAVEGIDAVVTGHQHRVWPSEDFAGDGHRPRHRHAQRQAGDDGGLLGLAHGADRPACSQQDGGSWTVAGVRDERPADLPAQRGPQRSPRWSPTSPRRSTRRRRCTRRRSTTCAPRSARSTAPLQSYFAVVADDPSVQIVSQAQTWYVDRPAEGHRVGGPAGPLGGRAVQVGRPRRAGVLHRRPGRADRDQERRRRLPLPQHAAGGGDHRRRGEGLAGALGRHLQPDHPGRRRPAADRPGLPRLQLRHHRRRHLRDRRDPAVEVTTPTASW